MTIGEEDWVLLNAYADGELDAAEEAALCQRLGREPLLAEELAKIQGVKASLARLRPVATASVDPPIRKPKSPLWALAAAVTLLVAVGFSAYSLLTTGPGASRVAQKPDAAEQSETGQQSAAVSLESGTRMGGLTAPDLSASSLKLIEMAVQAEAAGERVSMTYRGPNGCRVLLVARPKAAPPLAESAALQARWATPRAAFTLTANGMDRQRFAAIADYAEAQVRAAEEQEALRIALIDSTASAAPCA